MQGPKVFITYRREETAAHAGRLYDAMVARFGEDNVFMDVDMAPGVDFVERITEAVAACHVLIVVMGPRWATVQDEQGRARLADPEDFVRLEVETALKRPEVTPIPVLVSGARMPNREDLPPELGAIARRNALELDDHRWRYDVGRLISTLDELLAESPLAPGPSSPERDVATGKAAPSDSARPRADRAAIDRCGPEVRRDQTGSAARAAPGGSGGGRCSARRRSPRSWSRSLSWLMGAATTGRTKRRRLVGAAQLPSQRSSPKPICLTSSSLARTRPENSNSVRRVGCRYQEDLPRPTRTS